VRYPSDMPRPSRKEGRAERRGGSNRGRIALGVVIVAVVVLALSLRAIATFWTDYLWFDALDLTSVWGRLLSAKVTLGAATTLVFFALLWTNLIVAERLAPRFRPSVGPEDEILVRYRDLVAGRQRLLWLVVALVVSIVPGFSASAQWREWLLFRFGGDFGIDDPQFSTDIGFYVFKLPFLTTAVDWLFGFLIVTTLAVAVVHYLNGAIRVQPMGERVSPNAKAHLSVLLAAAALTKAADYWLQRYELVISSGESFDGAGYTDVNAALPAIQLMVLISAFTGFLLLFNIRRKGWTLPVIILGLWGVIAILAGSIYPAFVQRFQVEPAELAKERPFIEHNIDATRDALLLSGVEQTDFEYSPQITEEDRAADAENLENARVLDPTIMLPTIQDMQFQREYYTFYDVDVDRYEIEDRRTPVIISSRELNLAGVTAPSWEKLHLVFTHGYAAAVAPSNTANNRGEPNFLVSGIPPKVEDLPAIEQPEIYHGERMEGYAIVGTKQTELSDDNVSATYAGDAGVPIDSSVRRAAFALRFGEIEPLISDSITDESKVIYNRDVIERVHEIAPFLETDQDPYPVLLDGRVQYLVDAYTTTANYPYAQRVDAAAVAEGANGRFNYLRNSVKALVDSYDGDVTLYLTDELYGEPDPIIRAYAKAFPDLFTEEIPDEVRAHFRYPEFLFKTQTHMWGRYHQSNPSTFFNNSDRWTVAPAPSDRGVDADGDSSTAQEGQGPIEPYYQEMKIGSAETSQFVLTRPFVLSAGNEGRTLTSVMIARNDPQNYGKLEEIVMVSDVDGEVQRNNDVDGPIQANRKMVVYPPLAEYQLQLGRNGSRVRYGNLLIIPQGNTLLYMRPIYAAEESSGKFTLQRVVVAAGDGVGFGEDVDKAMDDLLDSNPEAAVGGSPEEVDGEEPDAPTTTVPDGSTSVEDLLAQADERFSQADDALRQRGDLAEYQRLVQQAQDLVRRAADAMGTPSSTTSSTTTTTAAPDTAD